MDYSILMSVMESNKFKHIEILCGNSSFLRPTIEGQSLKFSSITPSALNPIPHA